jgi:hypothetical protein
MSALRDRLSQDLRLAGLNPATQQVYVRAVKQLATYYMRSPDQLEERQVQDYVLYVRDELGVARGTFEPMWAGLKFFYLNTLGREWPLFTKKKSASHARNACPTCAAMTTAAA